MCIVLIITNDVYHDRLPESQNQNNPPSCKWKPAGKNEKFPRYLKNPKNLKSSKKNEIHAVGYSTCQQLEKNNKKFSDEWGRFWVRTEKKQ